MMDWNDINLDFTNNAWESLYEVVDNQYFENQDADLIFNTLEKKLRFIPFGEYLRRYIYRKAGFERPYEEVDIKEYQSIIKASFAENYTPSSFEPTTAKLSALSRNWLSQQTVKRNIVFLLGFGLSMSPEDVNEFLTKALREQEINAKNPFEVICWYCYKNKFNYLKFESLWNQYSVVSTQVFPVDINGDYTFGARNAMRLLHNDESLLAMLSKLKTSDNRIKFSLTARKYFDELYDSARDIIAEIYNEQLATVKKHELIEYENALANSDRLSDYDKQLRIKEKRERPVEKYHREDISESDMERILCAAIPMDRNGNLTPSKASKLNYQFAGKRFSRQHISDIRAGKTEVNRFDLITLNFFIYSQQVDLFQSVKHRYVQFVESTNRILESCYLAPLYIANPYECFVLMCILSEDPLGTYADVWELSFHR